MYSAAYQHHAMHTSSRQILAMHGSLTWSTKEGQIIAEVRKTLANEKASKADHDIAVSGSIIHLSPSAMPNPARQQEQQSRTIL